MSGPPSNPSDDRGKRPDDDTLTRRPRRDSLADSDVSGFAHGRFEPGHRLGSRYRIVGLLGRGGMGEVYRADDLELGQSVALKFLPERVAADPRWLNRFRNEVRTARQIAHPNVCRIYDIAEQDGHVFIAMEYVDGEDLAGVLRRLGRPSREKAIEIARQICMGIAAAHENKVLHRDLKPANVMIDGRGRVRITDFGLAGFLEELEKAEARAGTPAYMAPEQLADGKVSVRSDVYSLGLILYELFTGKSVFETNDIDELKRKHSSGTLSTPSSVTDQIDPAVERVIMRCLEQQPERRPQSVFQVLAALPGGDPLAAALAAGETPSPELVANARDTGGLTPAMAAGLVAALLASLALTYFVTRETTVVPAGPPTELAVVAGQIMEELGYAELPGRSLSGYDSNTLLIRKLRSSPRSYSELSEQQWPPTSRFWRRWTEGTFESLNSHAPEAFAFDGATSTPRATASIGLDSNGRLLSLLVGPSVSKSSARTAETVEWSTLIRRAGLDGLESTPVDVVRTPPLYCDEIRALRFDPHGIGWPIMIQMGAVAGRPNYFEIVGLEERMQPRWGGILTTMRIPNFISIPINLFMFVLAWRNLRAKRGDWRNALRCAVIVGGLYALMESLSSVLGKTPAFNLYFGVGTGHVLIHTAQIWVTYMAIEPYVRRIWPRMLVGLVRLLSGRLRDPAVGREVLIGLITGCGLAALLAVTSTTELRMQLDDAATLPGTAALWTKLSPLIFTAMTAHRAAWTGMDVAHIAVVLVAVRLLVKNSHAALVLNGMVLIGASLSWCVTAAGLSLWLGGAYAVCFGAAMVFLYTRVGILAAIVAIFVLRPDGVFTGELTGWFAPYGTAWLVILFAMGAYGFWVALAGQPILRDLLAEPKLEV